MAYTCDKCGKSDLPDSHAFLQHLSICPAFRKAQEELEASRDRRAKFYRIKEMAKTVEEDQSTPANMSPQVAISQSLENQNPDTFQIPVDENDGSNHTINNIYSTKPYTMKRGRAIKPDWVDEDGNPRWNDEEDDEEWGKEKSKGKGKGKGKSSKGGKDR